MVVFQRQFGAVSVAYPIHRVVFTAQAFFEAFANHEVVFNQ
jgi:hypothetical protein